MLDPWASQHHAFRKMIYANCWEKKNLNGADTVICVSTKEGEIIRKFGVSVPIAVIPNGIDRSQADNLPPKARFLSKHPEFRGKFITLFLGRIHPKKGVDLLIRAFHKLFQPPAHTHLIIAGPEEHASYVGSLKQLVISLNIAHGVTFLGPIFGEEKKELLTGCDLFVLPSHDEGFSIAVLEAMACALPVIVTENCNFPEVERFQAGYVVPHDLDKLVLAMSRVAVDEKKSTQMGVNGRKLVLGSYQWDAIALRMLQIYRQIIEKRSAKKC